MQIKSSSQSMTTSQLNSFQVSNQTSPKLNKDALNTNSPASEFDFAAHVPSALQGQGQLSGESPRKLIKVENQQPNTVSGKLETNIKDIIPNVQPNPASPVSETQVS